MKLVQIITLIFCLGIFLVPKDNFYAQNMQETCCKNDSEMNCCKKDHQHSKENHSKKEQQSSCNDDCCSTCITCYTHIETPGFKNLQAEIPSYQSDKHLPFEYSDPYFSDRLKEIWQPPKIG